MLKLTTCLLGLMVEPLNKNAKRRPAIILAGRLFVD